MTYLDFLERAVTMEPETQSQSADQAAQAEGDDILEQASGGKGVNRNSFSLD